MQVRSSLFLLLTAAMLLPAAGIAGPKHKEEFWDGPCKVKRKYDKHGGYKEERKCKGEQYVPAPVIVQPAPVVVQPAPVVDPGLVIQGTMRIK